MSLTVFDGNLNSVNGRIAGYGFIKTGNFNSYVKPNSPWSAYTGMWGHYKANDLYAESSMRIDPVTFPAGTRFNWDVMPRS